MSGAAPISAGQWFGNWGAFLMVTIAANTLGALAPRVGLPLITGFLFVGTLAGPFILGLLPASALPQLGLVTQFALAFICFSAGSELYLPELRPLFKRIAAVTSLVFLATFTLTTLFVFAVSAPGVGLVPFLEDTTPGCRASVATIFASIMVARSPASAIAVVKEVRAKGLFTSTMLGVTVLCDVVVLLAFTLSTTVAQTECRAGEEFASTAIFVTFAAIALSLVIGYGVGYFLILLMSLKRLPAVRYLILPLGLAIFAACTSLTNYTHEREDLPVIVLEPLLICICAGYVCTNKSKHRNRFVSVLQRSGPYIFLPFFTATGASLDLSVLFASIGFALALAIFRAATIFFGSAAGGYITGAPNQHSVYLWMTLLTQAGVSLGLAAEVGHTFSASWGRAVQTAIIAVVLINQISGPILCKFALRKVGEAGLAKAGEAGAHAGGDDEAPPPQALIIGSSGEALITATRLLRRGFDVLLLARDEAAAASATAAIKVYAEADRAAGAAGAASAHAGAGTSLASTSAFDAGVAALASSRGGGGGDVAGALRLLTRQALAVVKHGGDLRAAAAVAKADEKKKEEEHHEEEARPLEAGFRALPQPTPAGGDEWDKGSAPQVDAGGVEKAVGTYSAPGAVSVSVDGDATPTAATAAAATAAAAAVPSPSSSWDSNALSARIVGAMASLPHLSAVCVALGEGADAETFAACQEALRITSVAPHKSTLHATRVVAHVSHAWAPLVAAIGAMPVVGDVAAPALAAALLCTPLTQPLALLPAPGTLSALTTAVSDQLVEGPRLWALLGLGGGDAAATGSDGADAELLARAAATAAATAAERKKKAGSDGGGGASDSTVVATGPQGAALTPAPSSSSGRGFFSSILASLRHHVELDEGGDDDDEEGGAARGTSSSSIASSSTISSVSVRGHRGAAAAAPVVDGSGYKGEYGGASEAMAEVASEGGGSFSASRGEVVDFSAAKASAPAGRHLAAHSGGMGEVVAWGLLGQKSGSAGATSTSDW